MGRRKRSQNDVYLSSEGRLRQRRLIEVDATTTAGLLMREARRGSGGSGDVPGGVGSDQGAVDQSGLFGAELRRPASAISQADELPRGLAR